MGVSGGFAGNRTQPEAQRGVEAGATDPPVIQADLLAFPIFEEQLTNVAASQCGIEMVLGFGTVVPRICTLEEQPFGHGKCSHSGAFCPANGLPSGQINRLPGSRSSAVVPPPGRECNRRRPSCPSTT